MKETTLNSEMITNAILEVINDSNSANFSVVLFRNLKSEEPTMQAFYTHKSAYECLRKIYAIMRLEFAAPGQYNTEDDFANLVNRFVSRNHGEEALFCFGVSDPLHEQRYIAFVPTVEGVLYPYVFKDANGMLAVINELRARASLKALSFSDFMSALVR